GLDPFSVHVQTVAALQVSGHPLSVLVSNFCVNAANISVLYADFTTGLAPDSKRPFKYLFSLALGRCITHADTTERSWLNRLRTHEMLAISNFILLGKGRGRQTTCIQIFVSKFWPGILVFFRGIKNAV